MRFSFIMFLLLLNSCESSKESKFEVESCYVPKSKNSLTIEQVIKDLVLKNFNSSEEVFVIEIFSPSFHSAVLFSLEKRNRSFRINFYNSRIDVFDKKQMETVEKINVEDFIDLVKSDNHEFRDISKFTSYVCYKFKRQKLIYSDSRIDYRMEEDLAIRNNIKDIRELLDTYGDERKRCW